MCIRAGMGVSMYVTSLVREYRIDGAEAVGILGYTTNNALMYTPLALGLGFANLVGVC